MISICALLCGAETFVDFERFGKAKQEWLASFLALTNGIPSHDSFGRVFALMDPRQFSECFTRWTRGIRASLPAEIVAIDGKTLRRSHDRGNGKEPIHMVSAWARENGLALGQRKVDAMGCQKEIAQTITEVKADYVLALKGNQSSLHEDVKCFMEASIANAFTGVDHDFLETSKKAHGRYETRRYWVNEDIKWLTSFPQWQKLRSVGIVESVRLIKGVETTDCGK